MAAADGLLELQITELVMLFVDPSLYVPVAAYCCVPPVVSTADAGVTEMDTGTAPATPVTLSMADPV